MIEKYQLQVLIPYQNEGASSLFFIQIIYDMAQFDWPKTFFMTGTPNFHDGLHNYITESVNFCDGVCRIFMKIRFRDGF